MNFFNKGKDALNHTLSMTQEEASWNNKLKGFNGLVTLEEEVSVFLDWMLIEKDRN